MNLKMLKLKIQSKTHTTAELTKILQNKVCKIVR